MNRVSVRGWLFLLVLAVAVSLAPWPVWLVERWYARDIFPILQAQVTSLSNLVPIAVIDIGLVLLAVFLVGVVIRFARGIGKYGVVEALWEALRRVIRVAALLVLLFLVFWGLNYRREPLESTLGGGAVGGPPASAVLALAREAARSAGPLRGSALRADATYEDIAERLEPSFQSALQRLGLPRLRVAGRPKVSRVLTPFFTAAGVNGMLNPIALESIVHPELLPFERPMLLAHEWAHLAGFADEADASAVAWLACVSGDPALEYSAHVFVVLEAAGALPRDEWREIRKQLSPGVLLDFEALAKRLERQQPAVRENAMRVYDSYLKTNRVDDGVRSYSRVLRVLLTPGMRKAVAPPGRR
jgi:hypothetical protein